MREYSHFLFFSNQFDNGKVIISPEENRHIINVLRAQPGDTINITDGNGTIYQCRLASTCTAEIIHKTTSPAPSPSLTIAVGIPDKEHFDTIVEHCPPLGVQRIIPLITRHCSSKWWKGKWEKHRDRYEKKMISSIKQSLNPFLPIIEKPTEYTSWIKSQNGTIITADESGESIFSLNIPPQTDNIIAVVGPPGGFAEEELDFLKAKCSIMTKLSTYRLRTELAAIMISGSISMAIKYRH